MVWRISSSHGALASDLLRFVGKVSRANVSPPDMPRSWSSWSSARKRALAPGTKCFRAPARPEPGAHGTFQGLRTLLAATSRQWALILFICRQFIRSGAPNARERTMPIDAGADDPGSPWAIGARGRRSQVDSPGARHARRFQATGQESETNTASRSPWIWLFNAAPIIRTSTQHPQWFRRRPDRHRSNMPKIRQRNIRTSTRSISPPSGGSELWHELKSVVDFWIEQGIRIFRVDNPHTKPLPFWQWLIAEVKKDHPETIFLAEAFTRPKVMYRLAKLGFSQSYTYFAWRNTKPELIQYFQRAHQIRSARIFSSEPVAEHAGYPDRVFAVRRPAGVHDAIGSGGHAGRKLRNLRAGVRAAARTEPREPGSEEYLDSEKYQIKHWHSGTVPTV